MKASVYQALFENAPDPILVCTSDWRITDVNRRAGNYFSRAGEGLLGMPIAELCVDPFDADAFQARIEAGNGYEQILALRYAGDAVAFAIARGASVSVAGGERMFALYLYPLGGEMPGREASRPIAELLASLRSYRHMALTDALTELPNRRAIEDSLERECARSARQGSFLSVIMLDLDGFKRVNDRFGHLAGDEFLRRYAQLLRRLTRRSDFLGRYDGDEMLMVAPEIAAGAWSYAERLRIAVATKSLEPGLGRVTISAGIASKRPHPQDAKALVAQADAMLYEAKRAGGNAVRLISL